jgi:Dictyostelium (slime mold) repeat
VTRALAIAALCALAGCRGCDNGTGTVDPGFRVITEEVDFGRVLEGERAQRPVTLQNTTRLDIDVSASVADPFAVPVTVFLAGGSEATFQVEFRAGDAFAERTLTLEANGGEHTLQVKGTGVRPPNCTASGPCRDVRYNLEEDKCEEGPAPEGSACQTESLCLEKGECRSSMCVGVPRTCDDNDQCTVDSCSPASGCVHTPRICPLPGGQCKVATCDPTTGCGEGTAPDFTLCGAFTCTTGQFCLSGNCQTALTPDGFPCAPQTPCRGPGLCKSQQCAIPDAGILTADLTVPLAGHAPSTGAQLVAASGNVYTVLCGPFGDAGVSDAGSDAGSPEVCLVASWTGTGFDRYARPTEDGGERLLAGASARVAVNAGDAVEALVAATGNQPTRDSVAGTCGPSAIAHDPWGNLWALARDGGGATLARLPSLDGGLPASVSLPAPAELLAIDEAGGLWAFAPSTAWLGRVVDSDAGFTLAETLELFDAGLPALSVAQGTVAFGARWLSLAAPDGGRALTEFPTVDDGGLPVEWVSRDALMTQGIGAALYRQCDPPLTSCVDADKATFVVLFDARTGAHRWAARALPPFVPASVVEYAVGRATIPQPPSTVDFVAAAVVVNFDAGTQSYLQVFADGERTVLCPFPDGTALEAATWGDGRMYTLAQRADAGFFFEAWDMKGAPLSSTGWPKTNGVAGTRQAR